MISHTLNTEDTRVHHNEIRLNDEWEVIYWCLVLKCTKSELEEAVRSVGTSAAVVRDRIIAVKATHN